MIDDTKTKRLHLTLVDSVKTKEAKHISESWDALCVRLTKKPAITPDRESLDWPLFVPFKMLKESDGAKMNDYGHGATYSRRQSNVEYADIICFDIDNDPKLNRPTLTFDEAIERFDGLTYAMYTSYNHQNHYKGLVDKFRIVLPLEEQVTYEEFVERKQALKEIFPFIDLASLSISQPFYVPMAHPDRVKLHRTHEGTGEWLDLLSLEATKKPEPKARTATFEQTGDTYADLPTIHVAAKHGGGTYRADELYAKMQDGYEHRWGCYRIGAPDKKPGCWIQKFGNGLSYHDGGNRTFIKVMKAKKVRDLTNPEDDIEIETPQLWTRKPTTKPATTKKKPLVEYRDPEGKVELLHLNVRYLPDDLHLRVPVEGLTYIRSPKGTGKTEMLERLTEEASKNGESVLMLGHRVFLLENLAGRTNLDYYRDHAEERKLTKGMALCMNSLTWIDQNTDEPYDTVIIDESEQVFQALVSRTLHRDLSTIWNNLLWVFKKAKRIICLDADLSSELTMQMIKEIRGESIHDNVFGVINEYRIGEGKTTKIYEKRMHLLADALDAIHQGEKVFIACNNRKFATVVDAIVKDMGKKSLLVTAETNELEETQAFIENPTEESKKYDVVVTSPTLSTGVSIGKADDPTTNHFTKVYGFFGINPGTFQDVDQAICRVRNCDDLSVWVQGHNEKKLMHDDVERELYERLIEREKGTIKKLYAEETMLTQGQLRWASVHARIEYMIKIWSSNKDDQFCAMRRDLGFDIQMVLENEEKNRAGTSIYSQFKDVGVDRAQAVFDAAEIDPDEVLELLRKRQRSHDEKLSLERAQLFEQLRDHDWSVETVRAAQKQELLKSLGRLRMLHIFPDEYRIEADKQDRLKNQATFTASRHRVKQKELIDHLCKEARIDLVRLLEDAQREVETEIKRETMAAVAKAYEERKRDFNYYFNSRIKDPTESKNIKKVWDTTFGEHFSLCITRKKRGPKAKREYQYFLDLSKKSLVHEVMKEKAF